MSWLSHWPENVRSLLRYGDKEGVLLNLCYGKWSPEDKILAVDLLIAAIAEEPDDRALAENVGWALEVLVEEGAFTPEMGSTWQQAVEMTGDSRNRKSCGVKVIRKILLSHPGLGEDELLRILKGREDRERIVLHSSAGERVWKAAIQRYYPDSLLASAFLLRPDSMQVLEVREYVLRVVRCAPELLPRAIEWVDDETRKVAISKLATKAPRILSRLLVEISEEINLEIETEDFARLLASDRKEVREEAIRAHRHLRVPCR